MADTLIDIFNRILRYNENTVYIAFHSETSEPYFHATQVCKMMKYENPQVALQTNVPKENIFYLKNIVKNYKSLYKNVQGNTKFLNEAGLNYVILRGNKKLSNDIFNWVASEVLPSIRKYGEYRANHNYKKKISELEKILKDKQNEIEILKHNQKKQKFENKGAVYIMRIIDNDIEFDTNEIIDIKFGYTKDLNKRKPTYDTCTKNKVQILKVVYVEDPKIIETCVIKKMEDYQIADKKEYFQCSYNQIINAIASCVLYFEEDEIDITPDIKNISRETINSFDKDKKFIVKITNNLKSLNDDCDESEKNYVSETDTDSDMDLDSDLDIKINLQKGGSVNNYYYLKYLMCNLKILQLKYDFV
jgi:prophage antirepressor-like protein